MKEKANSNKKKRPAKKILLWSTAVFFIMVSVALVYLYMNLNRLLSDSLHTSFNSSIISDVYELNFEKLSVNLFAGNIEVHDVELQPREKPLRNYPYINSSFRLTTNKMLLKNVQLLTLIRSKILKLDKIEIVKPEVEMKITDRVPVFLPFKDTAATAARDDQNKKRPIESFKLKEFDMVDASFHVTNFAKEREFKIQKLNISLNDILIDQQPGKDLISYDHFEFSIEEFTGNLKRNALSYTGFKDLKITVDSLRLEQTLDTLIYHFAGIKMGIKDLDLQTADSIFHLTMGSFDLSYKERSIKLGRVSFKPNISDAEMQKRFAYQTSQFSGTVDTLNLLGVNFDSLIYKQKIFIDEIILDKASVSIFKDRTKPMDNNRFPEYLGQQIKNIRIPLVIRNVKATNVNLVNTERKPDGGYAKANINRGTIVVKNISNLSPDKMLTLDADAYIENKARTHLILNFSYLEPQFSIDGNIKRFNLTDLNTLLNSYVPAGINKGIVDEISFSGNAYRASASGTMKFLYHDLDVDLQLKEQAKWKNSVLSFAANTYLNASNPPSANLPPRIVQFHAERDMNKGFVNILIKSVLNGLKETMIMSKENRKDYRKEKKEAKRKAKNDRKKNEKDN